VFVCACVCAGKRERMSEFVCAKVSGLVGEWMGGCE